MGKVRVEQREGTGIMQDDSGLSTIQCNSILQKKSNNAYQITNAH